MGHRIFFGQHLSPLRIKKPELLLIEDAPHQYDLVHLLPD